jgi:hypothetical protein
VADGFPLVGRRDMGLMIFIAAGTAHIQKELCQPQIPLLAGDPIQLHQTHLDDFVSRPNVELFGTESITEQVGFLEGDVEHVGLAGGLVMRGGRLELVSCIIKFMALIRILQPPPGPRPIMGMFRVDGWRRVKVAVGFLRQRDRDQPVGFNAGRPEDIVAVNRRKWNRLDRIVARELTRVKGGSRGDQAGQAARDDQSLETPSSLQQPKSCA